MTMLEHAYLIPLIPLAVSFIILLAAPEDPRSPMPYVGIAAIGWCLIQSAAIFYGAAVGTIQLPYQMDWSWFSFGATVAGKPFLYDMPIGVFIDGPAAAMLVVVCVVSFLVQVYSLGYMRDDPRFKRYYAYLSFFSASMLGLVVSSNLLVTFCCWELVGFSSYILIGFWFERPDPAYAAKKAFITTKLG
ncbi:MAG: proton-conducting transporter membrane subunit, partial [Elusimicrobia bacterium]|nr:proton-conducting transporter membrane subunit [Elusimicrobiota bacterium]